MIISTTEYTKPTLIKYYTEVQSPLYVGLEGETYTKKMETYLTHVKPSGIVLMGSNVRTREQITHLVNEIHNYAKKRGIKIMISIDEEGGLVSRLKHIKGYPIEYKGIADRNSSHIKSQIKLIKEIGIDTNLAPVVDIAYTPNSIMYDRSAGDTPEKVSDIVISYSEQLESSNITPTLKHFPGLGRTRTDTHLEQATVDIGYEEWLKTDAIPYIDAINTLEKTHIMLSHAIYPQIDSTSTSMSAKWVDILRTDLNFKGKIITDDLKMAGAAKREGEMGACAKGTNLDGKSSYSQLLKTSLDAGVNHPMLIVSERETIDIVNEWISIEKECI